MGFERKLSNANQMSLQLNALLRQKLRCRQQAEHTAARVFKHPYLRPMQSAPVSIAASRQI